jgi:membrane-associated protease RseP (regulator of RpoE activity)
MAFVAIGAIRRRPIDLRIEAVVHGVGVLVLLALVLWLSWGEIGTRLKSHGAASAPDAGERAPKP